MKIYFNGVGDAFSEISYNTSFIVESQGYRLLIECPHPLFKILAEYKIQKPEWPSIDEINSVYISHLHGDHMNGLEGFGFYKGFVKKEQIELYIPNYYEYKLWHDRLGCAMSNGLNVFGEPTISFDENSFFNKHILYEDIFKIVGPFQIKIRQTVHHIPSFAIYISDGKKSVSFSSDTKFDMNLIKWLNVADLIIHESNYGPGHTNWNELNYLNPEIKKKMILIHLPDNFDTGSMVKAEDGMILEVS